MDHARSRGRAAAAHPRSRQAGQATFTGFRRSRTASAILQRAGPPAAPPRPGEDPAVCAAREPEEETGYAATTLLPLGGFFSSPGFTTEYLHAFVAVGLTQTAQSLDETEKIEVFPTTWQETMDKVEKNEIRDAKSVAILLKAAAFGVKRQRAAREGGWEVHAG